MTRMDWDRVRGERLARRPPLRVEQVVGRGVARPPNADPKKKAKRRKVGSRGRQEPLTPHPPRRKRGTTITVVSREEMERLFTRTEAPE